MTRTLVKLSTTLYDIAELMGMSKEEIVFFPKLKEVRDILNDYNFSVLSGEKAAVKLSDLKETLKADEIIFADGIDTLITKLTY